MMPAIILAGSHVWDADSLESICPRVLLPVSNAPLVDYLLDWLRDAGVDTVTLCANDASAPLQAYLGDGADREMDLYYYEDRIPRGPGGCLRDAMVMSDADQFLVVDGSILPGIDLARLVDTHARAGATCTVAVHESDESGQSNGRDLSPVGVYVFGRQSVAHVAATGYHDIKEGVIPYLSREGHQVTAHTTRRLTPRINGIESYFAVQEWALMRLATGSLPPPEGYVLRDGACVHRSARLADSVRLIGAVMIGPGTVVGDDAIIIGPSVIGRDCVLDRQAVIGRSIMWDECSIGEEAMIDQCLATGGAEVEAGAVRQSSVCCADPDRTRWSSAVRERSPNIGPEEAVVASQS